LAPLAHVLAQIGGIMKNNDHSTLDKLLISLIIVLHSSSWLGFDSRRPTKIVEVTQPLSSGCFFEASLYHAKKISFASAAHLAQCTKQYLASRQ
jgi:hypothetical protein